MQLIAYFSEKNVTFLTNLLHGAYPAVTFKAMFPCYATLQQKQPKEFLTVS